MNRKGFVKFVEIALGSILIFIIFMWLVGQYIISYMICGLLPWEECRDYYCNPFHFDYDPSKELSLENFCAASNFLFVSLILINIVPMIILFVIDKILDMREKEKAKKIIPDDREWFTLYFKVWVVLALLTILTFFMMTIGIFLGEMIMFFNALCPLSVILFIPLAGYTIYKFIEDVRKKK